MPFCSNCCTDGIFVFQLTHLERLNTMVPIQPPDHRHQRSQLRSGTSVWSGLIWSVFDLISVWFWSGFSPKSGFLIVLNKMFAGLVWSDLFSVWFRSGFQNQTGLVAIPGGSSKKRETLCRTSKFALTATSDYIYNYKCTMFCALWNSHPPQHSHTSL